MELVKIGKILKTHGYKGHMKVFVEDAYMDDFEKLDILFIGQLPYFITSKDIISDTVAIIALEGIDAKEIAQEMQTKNILAPEDKLSGILETEPYHEIIGFSITDKNYGIIGVLEQILEFPHQFLAKVQLEKKEILIPLNDHYIKAINEKQKIIEIELPDGFMEIF